jgi:hypothetical protein
MVRYLSERDEMYVQKEVFEFRKKEICIQRGRILGLSSSTLVEGLALYLAVADMSPKWVV